MWRAIQTGLEFARELYRNWRAGAPQRRAAQREKDYDGDVLELEQALKDGKAGALTRLFELERRAARKRGDPPGAAGDPGRLRGSAGHAGDPGGPDDQGGGLRGA